MPEDLDKSSRARQIQPHVRRRWAFVAVACFVVAACDYIVGTDFGGYHRAPDAGSEHATDAGNDSPRQDSGDDGRDTGNADVLDGGSGAESCKALLALQPEAASGVYQLNVGGARLDAYCEMEL